MDFTKGDKVIIKATGTEFLEQYIGTTGVVTGINSDSCQVEVFGGTQSGVWGFYNDNLELTKEAKEAMKFKVGDEVTMVSYNGDKIGTCIDNFIGQRGTLIESDGSFKPYKVDFPSRAIWLYDGDIELAKKPVESIDTTTALGLVLTGKVMQSDQWHYSHLVFRDNRFIIADGDGCLVYTWEEWCFTNNVSEYSWRELKDKPKPPKFSLGSLVYNTDGTIGKVMEVKGFNNGEQHYLVKFNAVRDTLKGAKESELTAYES